MRRFLPAFLLTLAAFGPVASLGCDLIKKKGDDGGVDAALAAVATPTVDGAAAPTETAPTTTTPTPLTPTSTVVVRPTTSDAGARLDAAVPAVDAGAPKADAGRIPTPIPTLTIPNLFDGGALKFDAGGFKPPWVR